MSHTENLKNRLILVVSAVASFFLVPIPLGILIFPNFHPIDFPITGYVMQVTQIFVFLILMYGAFAWVKPSLVPHYITKKITVGIMCGIVLLMVLPSGVFTLESVGSCTITNSSQGSKSVSNNSSSTEQDCIDDCIESGYTRYNAVSCEFNGIDRSWSKTPEDFQGYKPNIIN